MDSRIVAAGFLREELDALDALDAPLSALDAFHCHRPRSRDGGQMTAETRLAAVATKLTPLERARLVLRADFAGEPLDANLLRVMKPPVGASLRLATTAAAYIHNASPARARSAGTNSHPPSGAARWQQP